MVEWKYGEQKIKMTFLREIFSEDDGQGSCSRVMMFLHAIAAIGWGTHYVVHTHTIPDPTTMAGLTGFITAPYAVNKMHAAVTAFSSPQKS